MFTCGLDSRASTQKNLQLSSCSRPSMANMPRNGGAFGTVAMSVLSAFHVLFGGM